MSGAPSKLAQAFERRILLIDGAIGTQIQARDLSAAPQVHPAQASVRNSGLNEARRPRHGVLPDRRWQAGLLVLIAGFAVLALFAQGVRLGMRSGNVSIRYGWFAVPVAVSEQVYGYRGGYTAYRTVANVFLGSGQFTDDMLRRAANLPDPARDGIWFIFADDKGLVDFVHGAFTVFGPRFASLYDMYFLVLGLGLTLYVVAFFDRAARLLCLLFFLLGLYATLFVLPLTSELRTIHEPRFLGAVSVVPLMHVLFAMLEGPARPLVTACTAAQIPLMLFVYHMRSSELWQVMCVVAAAVIVLLATRGRRWLALWPAPLLVAGVLGVEGYKATAYHPDYFRGSLSSHIVWHNMFMGFSVNPSLAKRWRIDIDDKLIFDAAETYLRERNDQERWRAIFGQPDYEREGYAHFNWRLYDAVMRDMFLETLATSPRQVAATLLYYKPRLLYRQFAYASGARVPTPDLYLRNHALADRKSRVRQGLFYRPLGWEMLAFIAGALAIARPLDVREQWLALLVCAQVLAWSLLPGVLTYPTIHVVGVVFVTAAMTLYGAAAAGVAVLSARLRTHAFSAHGGEPAC